MQESGLSRREREKLRHRQEILDVALQLFSEKGFHNVSMHEIAQKAEFAIGTMYKFFKNKADLYRALVLDLADKFHYGLTKAIEQPGNEIEKIENYIRAKGDVFISNVPMIRLYLAETRGATFNVKAGLDEELKERYEEFMARLAGIFESGIRKKLFRPVAAPYYLAVSINSITNAFLMLWLEDPDSHLYHENVNTILRIFFEGVCRETGCTAETGR